MPNQSTLTDLQARIARREVSARDAVQACLDRIRNVDSNVRAFLSVDEEDALAQAAAIDDLPQNSDHPKPLLGIPVALKDNLAVRDQPLTCASKILDGFVSPYNATVIEKLKAAGAVVFGRLNMDEFAMGSSTENSSAHVTCNPWDLKHVPGGSSGGCAAAVCADECVASIGSDTGGSIRQPAAFCGCVGLKPTYGRVSRYGLVAFASSLDQIGPVTKTVEDSARLLNVLSGHDDRDATSVKEPVPDYTAGLTGDIKGMKLGLPKEYMVDGMDPEVRAAIETAVRHLTGLGAEMVEVSLPHTEYAIATYYIVATAEASANLARYDGVRYGHRQEGANPIEMYAKTRGAGFGPEVKRRILLGTYALSSGYYDAYYLRALKVRTLIRQDFEKAFEKVDAIITPTTPTPAFKAGEKVEDPLQMYLSDIFTNSSNLAGICGISLPCGFSESPKLPIGLQIMAKAFNEPTLFKVAHAYEQTTDWHLARPEL